VLREEGDAATREAHVFTVGGYERSGRCADGREVGNRRRRGSLGPTDRNKVSDGRLDRARASCNEYTTGLPDEDHITPCLCLEPTTTEPHFTTILANSGGVSARLAIFITGAPLLQGEIPNDASLQNW
jgi:hypothetical protein